MNYFFLQVKRLIKMLVFLVLLAAILVSVTLAVFAQLGDMMQSDRESKFKIAVVGNSDSRLFNLGLTALKTMDSSRFSIELELTDEQTAAAELRRGQISAYVVIPPGFTQAARHGQILPISYYTTTSTIDVSALMREEMTQVIAAILRQSQKGVFGGEMLLRDNGYADVAVAKINQINLQYIDFIIGRTKMYKTTITGVSYGLDFIQSLLVGISVVLLCVLVMPLTALLVRRDNSMLRLLRAAGRSVPGSALGEFCAMVLVFLLALAVLGGGMYGAGRLLPAERLPQFGIDAAAFIKSILPAAVMICAFGFAAAELSGNILSAVTGFFFLSMGLCYISGCMYPLYALPESLQKAAAFTPTGAARACISLSVSGAEHTAAAAAVIGYTVLFFAVAVGARGYKLSKGEN